MKSNFAFLMPPTAEDKFLEQEKTELGLNTEMRRAQNSWIKHALIWLNNHSKSKICFLN